MLSVAIQAGGQSTRMRENKALKSFLGRPLILRVIERLASVADELLVTTNQPDDYPFLTVPLLPDLMPDRGPLGGLYTALGSASHELVAVVACDMPFASASLITAGADILRQEQADLVIAETPEGFEPMHAIYRRESCLPAVKAAIEAGQWRVVSWFPSVKVRKFTREELTRYDPDGLAFWNVNTPREFEEAERRAADS